MHGMEVLPVPIGNSYLYGIANMFYDMKPSFVGIIAGVLLPQQWHCGICGHPCAHSLGSVGLPSVLGIVWNSKSD